MGKEHLKELIGRGEFEQAFTVLLGYGKKRRIGSWYHALLIQHSQFRKLEQDRLHGVLSTEEESLIRNRILLALLALIDELPAEEADGTPTESPVHEQVENIRRFPWLLIGTIVLLGLIAAYFKLNTFTPEETKETPPPETAVSEKNPTTVRPLLLPEGDEISFVLSTGDEINYRILKGELKNLGGGARQVSFIIRCSTRKGYGINFWDDSFRLELKEPGLLFAPSSGLNEVVASNSFKDGTVSFVVNEPLSNFKLAIINPWDREDIRKLPIGLE